MIEQKQSVRDNGQLQKSNLHAQDPRNREKSDWTIGRMIDWMSDYLKKHDDPNPLVSARWLVSDVTGLSFMQLYTNLDLVLVSTELDELRENVKKRASGVPLQYITGKTTFRFIDVKIRPGVLIPRPETEVLVSEVLSRLPRDKHVSESEPPEPDLLVCDLCTGSGCIAASLAHENPRIMAIATDISSDCAALASENIKDLGLDERVEVVECDLGSGVDDGLMGSFDAIVSNPPYIPSKQMTMLPSEVGEYEPALALDGGEDGLDLFRRISKWSFDALKPNGFLACELHEDTLDSAAKIAKGDGFSGVCIVRDLNDLPRILIATKQGDSDQANLLKPSESSYDKNRQAAK